MQRRMKFPGRAAFVKVAGSDFVLPCLDELLTPAQVFKRMRYLRLVPAANNTVRHDDIAAYRFHEYCLLFSCFVWLTKATAENYFQQTDRATGKLSFLDIVAVYRPRHELQKAAPPNFDAFFERVYFGKQNKRSANPRGAP